MIDLSPYFKQQDELPGAALDARHPALCGYRQVPAAIYRAHPALNASTLKEPSAGHMWHRMNEPDVDGYTSAAQAESFTMGTLVHLVCLEPEKLRGSQRDNHLMLCPTEGLNTKAAAAARRENPGLLLVTADHVAKAAQLMDAVWGQAEAAELMRRPGVNEMSGFCHAGGVARKWRPDRVLCDGSRIIDVKTTRHPLVKASVWESECWKMGYWMQAAWYLDCHEMLAGLRASSYTWLCVTTTEPFHARCFTALNPAPDRGDWHPQSALNRARRALGLLSADEGTISRLDMWQQAARETLATQTRGQHLTPALLRQLWPVCEHEAEGPLIGLPPLHAA